MVKTPYGTNQRNPRALSFRGAAVLHGRDDLAEDIVSEGFGLIVREGHGMLLSIR